METAVASMGGHKQDAPPRRSPWVWLQRILFYGYLLVVLSVFIYPMHYLAIDGDRVEVGRYILFMASVVYQPDSVQIMREVMVVTLIFLPLIHLAIRYGPETH